MSRGPAGRGSFGWQCEVVEKLSEGGRRDCAQKMTLRRRQFWPLRLGSGCGQDGRRGLPRESTWGGYEQVPPILTPGSVNPLAWALARLSVANLSWTLASWRCEACGKAGRLVASSPSRICSKMAARLWMITNQNTLQGVSTSTHHRLSPDPVSPTIAWDARGWRCESCGKAGRLELHHPKPLKNGGAALDDKNAKILCRACHISHHKRPPTPASLAWDDLVSRFR